MTTPAFWLPEMPGVLNWALEGLRRLRKAGGFTEPQSCADTLRAHREDSNPARRFLLEHYSHDPKLPPDDSPGKQDVYHAYRVWCVHNGHYCLASNAFGKEVMRAFKEVKDGKTSERPRQPRRNVYIGLRPVTPAPDTPF